MRTFGLIGYPLSHSFSQKYFADKFSSLGLDDCEFRNFRIENISDFSKIISKNSSLEGLSVTIPYKEAVIPFLDGLDQTAKSIGTVNCIKIKSKIKIGYNTDAFGFRQAIKPFLQSHHSKALILGTGGASKAVAYVLKEIGIEYFFVSRKKNPTNLSYHELNEQAIQNFPFIINTTPLGMFPEIETMPAIPYEAITEKHFLFDLIYNPAQTLFLKNGKAKGALVQNGLTMLKQQAEKSWEIWNS